MQQGSQGGGGTLQLDQRLREGPGPSKCLAVLRGLAAPRSQACYRHLQRRDQRLREGPGAPKGIAALRGFAAPMPQA